MLWKPDTRSEFQSPPSHTYFLLSYFLLWLSHCLSLPPKKKKKTTTTSQSSFCCLCYSTWQGHTVKVVAHPCPPFIILYWWVPSFSSWVFFSSFFLQYCSSLQLEPNLVWITHCEKWIKALQKDRGSTVSGAVTEDYFSFWHHPKWSNFYFQEAGNLGAKGEDRQTAYNALYSDCQAVAILISRPERSTHTHTHTHATTWNVKKITCAPHTHTCKCLTTSTHTHTRWHKV